MPIWIAHLYWQHDYTYRSSRPEVVCKKGLRPATLLKKRLWQKCFPANVAKFSRTPFLIKHLWWLLLHLVLGLGINNNNFQCHK